MFSSYKNIIYLKKPKTKENTKTKEKKLDIRGTFFQLKNSQDKTLHKIDKFNTELNIERCSHNDTSNSAATESRITTKVIIRKKKNNNNNNLKNEKKNKTLLKNNDSLLNSYYSLDNLINKNLTLNNNIKYLNKKKSKIINSNIQNQNLNSFLDKTKISKINNDSNKNLVPSIIKDNNNKLNSYYDIDSKYDNNLSEKNSNSSKRNKSTKIGRRKNDNFKQPLFPIKTAKSKKNINKDCFIKNIYSDKYQTNKKIRNYKLIEKKFNKNDDILTINYNILNQNTKKKIRKEKEEITNSRNSIKRNRFQDEYRNTIGGKDITPKILKKFKFSSRNSKPEKVQTLKYLSNSQKKSRCFITYDEKFKNDFNKQNENNKDCKTNTIKNNPKSEEKNKKINNNIENNNSEIDESTIKDENSYYSLNDIINKINNNYKIEIVGKNKKITKVNDLFKGKI